MRKVFKNEQLNQVLHKKGYVVVPFFEKTEIEALQTIFQHQVPKLDKEFYVSLWDTDLKKRREVHEYIEQVFIRRVEQYLEAYKFVVNTFAVKKASQNSDFFLHQDDTFTDETQFQSVSAWCPLVDVDAKNGALQVVIGSHKIFGDRLRGPTLPNSHAPLKDYLEKNCLTTVPMKAGEALFFRHELLHASEPNLSDSTRVAAVSVLIPKEAKVLFPYINSETEPKKIELLELEDNYYYTRFPLGKKPTGEGVKSIGFIDDKEVTVSKKEFLKHYLRNLSLKEKWRFYSRRLR